jgi:hypothetical protein
MNRAAGQDRDRDTDRETFWGTAEDRYTDTDL